MLLELIGSIAAPGEQKKKIRTNNNSENIRYKSSVDVLGNIWLHRLLLRSSDALSPLLMGALKRGVAAEEPCSVQLQDGSDSLAEGGGANEPGPRVYICGMTGAGVQEVAAGP